jgi:hypothetical protein
MFGLKAPLPRIKNKRAGRTLIGMPSKMAYCHQYGTQNHRPALTCTRSKDAEKGVDKQAQYRPYICEVPLREHELFDHIVDQERSHAVIGETFYISSETDEESFGMPEQGSLDHCHRLPLDLRSGWKREY